TDAHVLLPVALPLVTHPSPASRAPNSITSRAHDAHARRTSPRTPHAPAPAPTPSKAAAGPERHGGRRGDPVPAGVEEALVPPQAPPGRRPPGALPQPPRLPLPQERAHAPAPRARGLRR
uniref:Uncharacterized protein n=1 Tax=Aegilops tauschii subsp. strangulata TaxID=200361 RepID=A0A453PQK5_AEGTS